MTTERDKRRDTILKALAGVDLTRAHFTWGWNYELHRPAAWEVWVTQSDISPSGWVVWTAPTKEEVLSVRQEMEDLSLAARKLLT